MPGTSRPPEIMSIIDSSSAIRPRSITRTRSAIDVRAPRSWVTISTAQHSAFPGLTRVTDGRLMVAWRQGPEHAGGTDGTIWGGEFLLGDALANDADTLVTQGAIQSNHVRQTAAAAARFVMHGNRTDAVTRCERAV